VGATKELANTKLNTGLAANKDLERCWRVVLLLLFLGAAAVRLIDIGQSPKAFSWHEIDTAAIARNYSREGMQPWHPRIDWRGDGPGYVEMEFPICPWCIAWAYKLFGLHDWIGRLFSLALSLVTGWIFFKLARDLLPSASAIAATAFFLFSPTAVQIAHYIQPEAWMLCCYVGAVYTFLLWLEKGTWSLFWLAAGSTALAILTKMTAAHIGFLFAALVLQQYGWRRTLGDYRCWLFAIVALAPGLVWSLYARHLWLEYGNSLGISNEYHWLTKDPSTDWMFVTQIARIEIRYVWAPAALLLWIAAFAARRAQRATRLAIWWLAAAWLFYVTAARTTSATWSIYYHAFSVPPAALLFGAGLEALSAHLKSVRAATLVALTGAILLALALARGLPPVSRFPSTGMKWAVVLGGAALVSLVTLFACCLRFPDAEPNPFARGVPSWLMAGVAVAGVAGSFFYHSRAILDEVGSRVNPRLERCAQDLARSPWEPGWIVTSGLGTTGDDGLAVAVNAPYLFYWLDRKGFSLPADQQSLDRLASLASRGARYFVAEKQFLNQAPGFEAQLRKRLPVVYECDRLVAFSLQGLT